MRNRKVSDLAQSEEDSLEATPKSSDGAKTSTSSSSCPSQFSLSGQSQASALQDINKVDGDEKKDEMEVEQLQEEEEELLAQRSSIYRAIGGADAPQPEEAAPAPTNDNRCAKCKKKLGLTGGFPCRCGGVYCAVHRYSDRHECSFDYRELGASEIRRDNPLIVPSKLKKL
ncbi:AN1-type zinc finger protein 6 [Drosophila kikkawai]|uniref:AN1-type zinc finger protein 6 n=1 Tax=Drosophila kikkawai TaxID=30033 RepID=A0A6P4HQ42_DROKI|nr:AN1-type zinc finger protein 6 [Drosophila kikkawai]